MNTRMNTTRKWMKKIRVKREGAHVLLFQGSQLLIKMCFLGHDLYSERENLNVQSVN